MGQSRAVNVYYGCVTTIFLMSPLLLLAIPTQLYLYLNVSNILDRGGPHRLKQVGGLGDADNGSLHCAGEDGRGEVGVNRRLRCP